eukprot:2999000-Amphidinium_carterae.1
MLPEATLPSTSLPVSFCAQHPCQQQLVLGCSEPVPGCEKTGSAQVAGFSVVQTQDDMGRAHARSMPFEPTKSSSSGKQKVLTTETQPQ